MDMLIETVTRKSVLPFGLFVKKSKNSKKKQKTVTKVAVTFTVSLGKCSPSGCEDGDEDHHNLVLGGLKDSLADSSLCGINCCNLDFIYI